jgi:hypothetical protein
VPSNNREALEAIRSLLLPVYDFAEPQALYAAMEAAEDEGVEHQDFAATVHYEAEDWRNNKAVSPLLKAIVEAFIQGQGTDESTTLAKEYFGLHEGLQKENFLLGFDQASAFLSHAYLIIKLAIGNLITASQIARILATHDQRAPFSRQSVALVLSKLNLNSEISDTKISQLYEKDKELSVKILADAELASCSNLVGGIAKKLGIDAPVEELLDALIAQERITDYAPYLQILHYQCSVTEYFDFATIDLYEFNPRGVAALTLFEKYPAKLNKAGNPFLNNAKSVEQITLAWARSKKSKYFSGAKALYYLLENLNSLGFSARRELSFWIRLWLHRVILINANEPTKLSSSITERQASRLIGFTSSGNTSTSGVIEQRLVDAAAKARHSDEAVWMPRGLKDSVNTTNISKKKLGDCDFQNPENLTVFAYEAHGGKLTDIYLREHVRTIRKILPYRIEEWATFSNVGDWRVKVVFVAHEIALEQTDRIFNIDGVSIAIETTTFSDFLNSFELAVITPLIEEYVLIPLSEARVPESIRQKIRNVIAT